MWCKCRERDYGLWKWGTRMQTWLNWRCKLKNYVKNNFIKVLNSVHSSYFILNSAQSKILKHGKLNSEIGEAKTLRRYGTWRRHVFRDAVLKGEPQPKSRYKRAGWRIIFVNWLTNRNFRGRVMTWEGALWWSWPPRRRHGVLRGNSQTSSFL